MKTILSRAQSKTPPFFKKLQSVALGAAAVAGIILTAPLALPVAITTAAGYLVTAAGAVSTVCQLTVKDENSHAKRRKGGKQNDVSQ